MRFYLLILLNFTFWSCNQEKQKSINEIIVIGGGLIGSSTAWHLSKQDKSVLLLEKQDSIYTYGSSYGEARIARINNRQNDIWSYLHNRSVKETKVLVDFLNSTGNNSPYKIEHIYTTSPVTYVARIRVYDKLIASLKRQKVEYDLAISSKEGMTKFGIKLPDSVLIQREYNQHSGTMNPRRLISYLHQAIRKKGNQISYNTKVTDINYNSQRNLYEIKTINEISGQTESFLSRKVLSAAGPYTGKLLKHIAPYFDTLIKPQRVFLAFFKIKEDVYDLLSENDKNKLKEFYPVINASKGTRHGNFFSMIEYFDDNNHPLIKIGGHFQRTPIHDLDKIWTQELTETEIEWSKKNTADYLKLLNLPIKIGDLKLAKEYSCVYSLTKTEVPFVTPIVKEEKLPNNNFIVLGGMSGVGAKGAMTYGLIAANLMNNRTQSDSLYIVTAKALGFERLVNDLQN